MGDSSSDLHGGPPEEVFASANDAMQKKQYVKATELYTELLNNHPFSPFSVEAELSLADAYFLNGQYPEAVEAYKAFDELHPRNTAIPYVLYQIGTALLRTNDSVDKTAAEAQEAIQYFDRLRAAYPDSQYTSEAKQAKGQARTLLAERELYAASVFASMGNNSAAYKRYTYVAENFPDLPQIQQYAHERAKGSFLEYTEDMSEAERRSQYGSWRNYFDWL